MTQLYVIKPLRPAHEEHAETIPLGPTQHPGITRTLLYHPKPR